MATDTDESYAYLLALEEKLCTESAGKVVSLDSYKSVIPNRELLVHILNCLLSDDFKKIGRAFFTMQGVFRSRELVTIPQGIRESLVGRIGHLVSSEIPSVRYTAIDWFTAFRGSYPNYRERMLELLRSEDAGDRHAALRHYQAYAEIGEVSPLIKFRNDDNAAETSMMGPMKYYLRDKALELAEKQTGKKFRNRICSKPYDGTTVSWYDWSVFLEWYLRAPKQ